MREKNRVRLVDVAKDGDIADPFQVSDTRPAAHDVQCSLLPIRSHPRLEADDDFAINQQEVIINTFRRVGGTIASVGLFITGLSLFVGGIGIMNIMFVSVAERTREIGIRKAIGAKRRTILIQFLIEAAIVCSFGGLIGLAIAFAASFGVQQLMPTSITPTVVALAMGMAILTGLVAGFVPAWRAARMNPVDALRAE